MCSPIALPYTNSTVRFTRIGQGYNKSITDKSARIHDFTETSIFNYQTLIVDRSLETDIKLIILNITRNYRIYGTN